MKYQRAAHEIAELAAAKKGVVLPYGWYQAFFPTGEPLGDAKPTRVIDCIEAALRRASAA